MPNKPHCLGKVGYALTCIEVLAILLKNVCSINIIYFNMLNTRQTIMNATI